MTTLVQSKRIGGGGGGTSGSFNTAPTVGNLVVIYVNHRDGTPSIYTGLITQFGVAGGGPGAQGCRGGYRVWQSGDSNFFSFDGRAVIMEFAGGYTLTGTPVAMDEPGNDTVAYFGGDVTGLTNGTVGLLVGDDMGASDGQSFTYSGASGVNIVDQKNDGSAPAWCVAWKDHTVSGTTAGFRGTKTSSVNTGGIQAFFVSSAAPAATARSTIPAIIG